ncbi:ArnT family glycosyltransferase [Nonomuraea polychroma]|uniref:ArnT family glycosyltransferase n=1 Tax=Nonomuraea polychroma TaxID=46176 RepID=UPI003D949EC9
MPEHVKRSDTETTQTEDVERSEAGTTPVEDVEHSNAGTTPAEEVERSETEMTPPDDARRPEPVQITLPAIRTGPVMGVGLLLILVSLVFKASVLSKAYFVEDDFLFVAGASDSGLTWDYLTRVHKGHLMPGALALVWVLTSVAAYHWALVSFVTLAIQAAASIVFLVLLRRLFGDRAVVLAALTVYVFAPLTVPAMSWWSAALNAVPLQLALVAALAAHIRYVREGKGRWHALIWTAVGMAFSTKGVFIPFVVLGITSAYLGKGLWARALLAELRRPVWWAHGLLLAGYALLYLLRRDSAGSDALTGPKAEVVPGLLRRLLGETFPTGAVGGPLRWGGLTSTGGLADPAQATVIGSWAVIVLAVVVTCVYRRRAWRAWAILAAYVVVADALPTTIARATAWDLVGAETRYVADAAVLVALCLALAWQPVEGEPGDARRRPVPGTLSLAAGGLTVTFLVVSLVSINAFADTLTGDKIRKYVDNARASLATAAPDADIYARPVPPEVVLPWNGPRRLTSYVLAPLADPEMRERMREPRPSAEPYVFDATGKLVLVGRVAPFFDAVKGRKCYPAARVFPVESLGGPGMVVAMAYVSPQPVQVVVDLGGTQRAATLPATGVMGALFYVPHDGAGKGMRISAAGGQGQAFCLRAVAFGEPGPAPPAL